MAEQSNSNQIDPGSFRDPSGFIFYDQGAVYRQINQCYAAEYDRLISSGLYEKLREDNLIVPHTEADLGLARSDSVYKVIQPERIAFFSYPYEYCFSQLKAAALATLAIQKTALEHKMSLKDASAYNIQFHNGKPLLIDTLSFEPYDEGKPWVAYPQFCQHFLAPLLLMSRVDIRLGNLLRDYIDGIPIDLASRLLPGKTKLSFSILTHIHLHAKSQSKFAETDIKKERRKMPLRSLLGLIDNLESTVKAQDWQPAGTVWGDYYDKTNYSDKAEEHKKEIAARFLSEINPTSVWDLGANTGVYSKLASTKDIPTVAFDIDPAAVELNYCESVKAGDRYILPLLIDLTNPSPSLGWANRERKSLAERGPVDTVMALALVHHLAIANNVPLSSIAEYFSTLAKNLIIEFVPKEDSQTKRLLSSREDIFDQYNSHGFEEAFAGFYEIIEKIAVDDSARMIYRMRRTV